MQLPIHHLRQKGRGRPVGPDGVHPNVYGNFIMTLAILGELRSDIASWRLDGLNRRFLHPESGGDVATIGGFTKDPSDGQRGEILQDLRGIVVRELAKSSSKFVPAFTSGIPRILHRGLNEVHEGLEWIAVGIEEHDPLLLTSLKTEPGYDTLRSQPASAALLRKMNLEP